jgi:Tfp pilus assembly protein PilZ
MRDTGAERRNYARERTDLPVAIRSGMVQIQAKITYLGFGGAFVNTSKTFLADSVVELEMDLPGQPVSFHGPARVVWVHKNRAMGLQFLDLPPAERLKLEQFLVSS